MPPKKKRNVDDDANTSSSKRLRAAADEIDAKERAAWVKEKAEMQANILSLTIRRDDAESYLGAITSLHTNQNPFSTASENEEAIHAEFMKMKDEKCVADRQIEDLEAEKAKGISSAKQTSHMTKEIEELKGKLRGKEKQCDDYEFARDTYYRLWQKERGHKCKIYRHEAALNTIENAIKDIRSQSA